MNLLTATEFTGLVIGIGGASTVVVKGARMARRFGHFIDKLAGNGGREPGILKRLDDLQSTVDDLTHGQVTLTQGQDELKRKLDQHIDSEVPTWRAEGEAWGHRLDNQVADHDQRLSRLEQDPLTGPPA